MREFRLTQADLQQILSEARDAHLLDSTNNILASKDFYEKFIDHYEPSLYKCEHSNFDKELLMCIGEIAIENGAESLYEEFDADVILDYLNILENLGTLSYDSVENKYHVLDTPEEFRDKCKYIPEPKKILAHISALDEIDKMEGHEFEHACAEILKSNGFDNVYVTKASGDHGADIFAVKEDISYIFQCKRYSDTVPNDAVQAAFSAKNMFKKDIAVVMTNSYLSSHGLKEAESLNVKVWDRDKLNDLIRHATQ